jgi:hypothetical protein
MVRASFERNAYLLANLSPDEIAHLDRILEELTRRAVEMLRAEQNHDTEARLPRRSVELWGIAPDSASGCC